MPQRPFSLHAGQHPGTGVFGLSTARSGKEAVEQLNNVIHGGISFAPAFDGFSSLFASTDLL